MQKGALVNSTTDNTQEIYAKTEEIQKCIEQRNVVRLRKTGRAYTVKLI